MCDGRYLIYNVLDDDQAFMCSDLVCSYMSDKPSYILDRDKLFPWIQSRQFPLALKTDINYALPSNPTITKEVDRFTADAGHPGILNLSLEAFAARQLGQDIKLPIDGEKIAIGFGNMGDEDLAADKPSPT
ncbi:Hypothetical predicted protein [Mytilus galloprovincialis]|uniref:Uncharacterized protein n=1 Tax=Mytilus galloprovincialis TaxID=29158 RepID=A0A8B6D6B1_MYTGA|nr:Hypothetical predicted protein [Mytilus galloprovincialis]